MLDARWKFARLIADARRASPIRTQEALAAELGVSQSTVSGWEGARAVPAVATLDDLARVLELDGGQVLAAAAAAARVPVDA